MPQSDCQLCSPQPAKSAGHRRIAHSDHWDLTVFPGYDLPGWYFLQSRSHVSSLAQLSAVALSEFGACLSEAIEAVRASSECDKVYLYRFGENHEHWHLLLCARPDSIPEESRGPSFLFDRERYRDDAALLSASSHAESILKDWPVRVALSSRAGG